MNRVKIADLKNNLSKYLEGVRAGGELVVLDRETPIARLIPFTADAGARRAGRARHDDWTTERLQHLERRGVIDRPASEARLKAMKPIRLPKGSPSLVETLVRIRRESRR